MTFKDHFSGHAEQYVKFRPTYPDALYKGIYEQVNDFDLAWDCGTGNGQVAVELAKRFDKVVATDASQQQIESAIPAERVEYFVSKAEQIFLPDKSVDLLTVGQALHWFDFEAFFKEVERVIKPNGVLACWTYKYLTINETLDGVLLKFFEHIETYWPPERDHVAAEYQTIPFPKEFQNVHFPDIFIERAMTAAETLNYLRTWSAVKNYKLKHNGEDPLLLIEAEFFKVWGMERDKRIVKHPLITKIFKF
ncbi:MAG: class I SAM-dependent methyltransferase [Bacteroidetes bacterium]|nr:class I SAM-dependent methyltransferase [Bacteroidota bacterium]